MHPRYLPPGERLVYLAEYHVRQGVAMQPNPRVASLELIDEADEDPTGDPALEAPVAEAPAPAPDPAADPAAVPPADPAQAPPAPAAPGLAPPPAPGAPAADPAAGPDKLEILTKLAHAQQEQAASLLDRIEQLGKDMETTDRDAEARVRALDDRLEAVNNQVRKLTPPSPLEQLKSMATITGGVSMEDYFNEWAAKNGDPTRVGPNGMYQAAENPDGKGETFYVDTTKVPALSGDAAKRSLGLGS